MSPLEPDDDLSMDSIGKVLRQIQVGQHAMRRQLDKLEAEVDGVLGQIAEIRTTRDVEAGAAAARERAAMEQRELDEKREAGEAKNREYQRRVMGATGTLLAAAVTAYLAWIGTAQYELQRDLGVALSGIDNLATRLEESIGGAEQRCKEHEESWEAIERRLDRQERRFERLEGRLGAERQER